MVTAVFLFVVSKKNVKKSPNPRKKLLATSPSARDTNLFIFLQVEKFFEHFVVKAVG